MPRTDARALGLRRTQSGQTAVEYIGLVVVVIAIMGALVATGGVPEAGKALGNKICQAVGGSCGADDGVDTQVQGDQGDDPGNPDPDPNGDPVTDDEGDGGQKTQTAIDYENALKELQDAQAAEKADRDKAIEAAKELAKILADELGITDALDCITKGDMGACTETLVNVLLSLVGGAVGKLAAKYGAPWKWKKAVELVQKLKKHGGDLYDGLRGLIKNRKRVGDAEDKLADAKRKLDAEKKEKPAACPVGHSFLPGTPVLLAGGLSVPIQAVRVGDRVIATDPANGVTASRRVTQTFTTYDDKHFTRISTPVGAVTATDTHPFWLPDERRWAEAGALAAGDELRLPDGTPLKVTAVSRYTQRQTTHDLAVADVHAYYVGIGSAYALVHNNDPCKEWAADPGVRGPAAGKTLKPPHKRHTVAGAKNGIVKPKNTIILKGREAEIDADIKGIAEGKAKLVDNGNAYEINGRKYGVEESGRTFPIGGDGLVQLDRFEYAALKEIAKAGGRTDLPPLTRDPKFTPEMVAKAKKIYDGTYP
ncbi:polymorphic toxin-type HINT domain-containing protein [Streptomyces sp. NPDC052236]|uniref:polymorphic toxin-type HINT domain-containing protein n=1 Tax=Streptomyces sp. NPDC052236 TaxID=3365686 RepID=UPI0037CDE1F7